MISNSWIVAANSYKNKIIGKSSAQFWKEQILELGVTTWFGQMHLKTPI
jgi:putative transcriptional regulator